MSETETTVDDPPDDLEVAAEDPAVEIAAPRFLGWRMVMIAFLVDFVAVGFFFYSYGVFFKAIASEFGDSRFGVSIGIMLTQVAGALVAPLVGQALDRYPLRIVQTVGALLMGGGFLLLGFVQSPFQFYLVLGFFIGCGAGAMGQLATSKLVANWFVRKRGTALGIAATGISVSGVIMPALSAWIILNFGWREGFMIYGVLTLAIVVPLVQRFVITRPEDVGMLPDGEQPDGEQVASPAMRVKLARTQTPPAASFLRDRNFWALTLIIGLLYCVQSGTLIHMVPRITDSGVSLASASFVMSLTALLGVAGKLTYGWLADRWDVRNALWLGIGFQVVGQLIMLLQTSYVAFGFGAAMFGFGMGGVVPMQGAAVGAAFGRESFGRVLGAMRLPMSGLQMIGTPLAGWMFDRTGSYDLAFCLFLGLYLVAAVGVLGLRIRDPR